MSMSATTSTEKGVPSTVRKYVLPQKGTLPDTRGKRTRSSHGNTTGRILTIAPPLILALIFFVSWYVSTVFGHVSSLFLPTPGDVLSSLSDGVSSGVYLSNTLVTVQESVLGFLLALVVALPLGYVIAKSRLFAATFQPYLSAGQAIPALVIAPLLVLWLGYSVLPKILVCALVVLFPMIINTIFGIQSIDTSLTDAARVEGAANWSLLSYVEFPLALPAVLAAVRTSFTLSITGALVGEFVSGGDTGLGSLVMLAKSQYNMPFMFATLLVLAALAALYYAATGLLVKLAARIY